MIQNPQTNLSNSSQKQQFVQFQKSNINNISHDNIPSSQQKQVEPIDLNLCQTHNKPFVSVCYTEQIAICEQCKSQHKEHHIIDPKKYDYDIGNKSLNLISQFGDIQGSLQNIELLSGQQKLNEGLLQLQRQKETILNIIDGYFNDIKDTFIHLCSLYPSNESKLLLQEKIQDVVKELHNVRDKQQTDQLKPLDIANFFKNNYNSKREQIQQQVQEFKDFQEKNMQELNFPSFHIWEKNVEQILMNLVHFVNPVYAGTIKSQHLESPYIHKDYSSLKIDIEPKIAVFSNNQEGLIEYNLKTSEQVYRPLVSDQSNELSQEKMPYQPSFTMLPDGKIFLSGGLDDEGYIQSQCYIYDTQSGQRIQVPPMRVKRCGHTLVYVKNERVAKFSGKSNNRIVEQLQEQQNSNSKHDISNHGFVYVIGGRTNSNFRTKLCERYNLQTRQWENIQSLQDARSRSACCHVNGQYLYAFYGTNSYQRSVTSIEKYDLMTDDWQFVETYNHLPGYDLSHAGAVQINQEQIIFLGGFRDQIYSYGGKLYNRKSYCYNIKYGTISVFNDYLPGDCIVQGQPVVYNGSVSVISSTMKQLGQRPMLNQDFFALYKIQCEGSTLEANIQEPKKQTNQQNSQQQLQPQQYQSQYQSQQIQQSQQYQPQQFQSLQQQIPLDSNQSQQQKQQQQQFQSTQQNPVITQSLQPFQSNYSDQPYRASQRIQQSQQPTNQGQRSNIFGGQFYANQPNQ